MEDPRIKTFRMLKPPCVNLSQVALRYKGKKATSKELTSALESLLGTLKAVIKQPDAFDPKLSEYAFFPLSHVFRDAKTLHVRAVETALQCLHILIFYGWREQLSTDLGKQLLILLCFLAGGSATDGSVKAVNEELATAAFDCLIALFQASRGTFLGIQAIQPENVPVFGHSVTVMLDGIAEGASLKVRLAALTAMEKLLGSVTDYEVLRNVLPGIVSVFTKVLSPKAQNKSSYHILSRSLKILAEIICQIMGDDRLIETQSQIDSKSVAPSGEQKPESWTIATAGQIRMALANILPLRYHDRIEVRSALLNLAASTLEQCRNSLSQCSPMLVETIIVVHSQVAGAEVKSNWKLAGLFAKDTALVDTLKSSLHDWIVALPRVMQSNDDTRKSRVISQISTAFKVLEEQDTSLGILSDVAVTNLQGSVAATLQASSNKVGPISESNLEVSQLLQMTTPASRSTSFSNVLFREPSNRITAANLQSMTAQLRDLSLLARSQKGLANNLRTTSGDEQLASLWLCLQLLKNDDSCDPILDRYLRSPQSPDVQQPLLDDIYAFSLETLAVSTFEDEDRWKLQCLSLEVVALQAHHQGYDFRPELVDALYPVLERLGSHNVALQQHSITCLNLISNACKYANAAALIVDNADYLVNAVALKLNTFDISPQAPQVLVTMIKLSGDALIPYLDDLIESIFSILASYHGYPKLVESLFSVLTAIVEEAAKSSTHLIISETDPSISKPQPYKPLTITELASLLQSNREASNRSASQPFELTPSSNPNTSTNDDSEPEPPPPQRTTSPPPHPLSKTHTLIHSIATLTPSHLTTPSPPLRAHILTLVTSAIPLLSTHTDTFLPFAATLWPAITPRLFHDTEPYVTFAAANALRTLCSCAGDFLAQRVEDEWERVGKLYRKVEGEMREERRVQGKGSVARGMRWKVWDAVVGLVVAVVGEVGVSGEMEDGVFEMLGGLVGEREDVRVVLEGLNVDAVWLAEERERLRRGGEALRRPEGVDGIEFREVGIV